MADYFDPMAAVQEGTNYVATLQAMAREKAAYDALTKVYGPMAGNPVAWGQAVTAATGQAGLPYVAPQAAATLAGTQANTGLTKAQADTANAGLPFVAPAAQADINQKIAQTGLETVQTQAGQAALPYVAAEKRAGISLSNAQAGEAAAAAAKDRFMTTTAAAQFTNPILANLNTGVQAARDKAVKMGQDPKAAVADYWRQVAPVLPSLGISPQEIQPIIDTTTANPYAADVYKGQLTASGGSGIDQNTVDYVAQQVRMGKVPTGMSRTKEGATLVLAATKRAAEMARQEGKSGEADYLNQQYLKGRQAYIDSLAQAGPTSAGGFLRSAGAVLAHMTTLDNLIVALQNGNVKGVNMAQQQFKEQTGVSAPVSFDAQKQVVADELTRYLIARGGTGEDRKNMLTVLSRANSPAQLKNVIDTWRTDMVGQLHAQKQQAQAFGATDQFNAQLTPDVRTLLSSYGRAASGGSVKVGDKLPGGFTVTGVSQ